MVFNGASVVKEIVNGLDRKLKSKGMTDLRQAVGIARVNDMLTHRSKLLIIGAILTAALAATVLVSTPKRRGQLTKSWMIQTVSKAEKLQFV